MTVPGAKPAKLVRNLALRAKVEKDLEQKYSPEQISGRLLVEFPDDPEMRVSQRPRLGRRGAQRPTPQND